METPPTIDGFDFSSIKLEIGTVAILDALGSKQKDPIKLLINLNYLLKHCENNLKFFNNTFKFLPSIKPEFTTFGDTLIITCENVNDDPDLTFITFCTYLVQIINAGLVFEIPYRGVISHGNYVLSRDRNAVLGPAIAEAATWYERADWIGLHLTPSTGLRYSKVRNNKINDNPTWRNYLNLILNQYQVPIKGSSPLHLWSLGWPIGYLYKCNEFNMEKLENLLLEHITALNIPYNSESKYLNSFEYFKWYFTKADKSSIENLIKNWQLNPE
jgi:hypothetical protein